MSAPPNKAIALHKGRTFATQSEEAKIAFAKKSYETTAQVLRFSFTLGKVTSLFAICDTLKIAPVGPDRHVSKEELTALVLRGREELHAKLAAPKSTTVEPVVETPVVEAPVVETVDDKGDETIPMPELTDNPRVQAFGFQVRKGRELFRNLTVKGHRANLLLSQTGSGKTYMLGAVMAAMKRTGYFEDYAGMYPMLYVTKASIVNQTQKVLTECFGLDDLDVMVTNVEQLRAMMGRIFLTEETIIVQGQEHIVFKWRVRPMPRLIVWDEAQILKNIDSTQSRIAQALNDVTELSHGKEANKLRQVFASATPFMRLVETKVFAAATKSEMEGM